MAPKRRPKTDAERPSPMRCFRCRADGPDGNCTREVADARLVAHGWSRIALTPWSSYFLCPECKEKPE